jgi:hypothetical protein
MLLQWNPSTDANGGVRRNESLCPIEGEGHFLTKWLAVFFYNVTAPLVQFGDYIKFKFC